MKKTSFLGYALTLALAIVAGSAMGQAAEKPANYVELGSGTSYVTEGTTTTLYVDEDPAYAGTTGVKWNWSISNDAGWETSPGTSNLASIKWGAVGSYTINVQEDMTGIAGFTGCDARVSDASIVVIPKPEITITTTSSEACVADVPGAMAINISVDEGNDLPGELRSYIFKYKIDVANLDGAGTETPLTEDVTAATNIRKLGHEFTINTPVLTVKNEKRTKYTFTILANSLSSAITRKADYAASKDATSLTDWTTFGPANDLVVSFIVNPKPVTGPIYHIPNTWAL